MMHRNFAIMSVFIICTGCVTTPPPIPQFPLKEKQKDTDGYYKYSTFWFKGNLKEGMPDGKGQCRTKYLTEVYGSEWLSGACEFKMGERIDRLHQKRSEGSLAFENQKRTEYLQEKKEEKRERELAEAEERRERARSRAAFEQNMAVSLGSLNQQMIRDHQQMSAMVQRASTPAVQVKTYTPSPSASTSSSSKSSSSGSSSSSSSSKSSSSSSSVSSSGETSNIGEINKKYQTEREKNLKAQEQKKLEQQKAYEAKLAKDQQERDEQEKVREKQLAEQEKQRQIQLANEKRERERQAEKERKERELLAKKQQEEQEKNNYLTSVKNGLRLKAVSCYGNNYPLGQMPKGLVFSKHVSGINVHYLAYCSGGGSYNGISRNFIGMGDGCFTGDTTGNEIPKSVLSCSAEEMTVEVTNVTPTR